MTRTAVNAAAPASVASSSNRRKTTSRPPQFHHSSAAAAAADSPGTAAAAAAGVQHQGQHDAADAAMYKEMREALHSFETQQNPVYNNITSNNNTTTTSSSSASTYSPKNKTPPRYKAFYSALRSVLAQVLEEKTESNRHTRLLAAHRWYVKHKPRPQPSDMDMAAAMAASLSVTCPTTGSITPSSAAAAAAAARTKSGSIASNSSQQQQQQFVVYGKPGQLFGEYQQQQQQQEINEIGVAGYNRSRTERWQHQQQRLHIDNNDDTSAAAAAAHSSAPLPSAAAAAERHLPEQPSMSQIPAIQQQVRGSGFTNSSSASGSGISGGGSSSSSSSSSNGGSAAAAGGIPSWSGCNGSYRIGSAAGATDGLVPLGSLPSQRFPFNSSSRSSGGGGGAAAAAAAGHNHNASGSGSRDGVLNLDNGYKTSKAQWQLVADAQQRIEAAVASQMQGYCRHRARLEEEICRKQEVSAQLAIQGDKSNSVTNSVSNGSNNRGPNSAGRRLVHMDSQHQPSEVAAYQWAGRGQQQLVPVNKIKEAKKKLLQETEQEVAEVAEQLVSLGVAADPAVLEHALLPVPDQAYMVCLAHLPKPGVSYGTVSGRKKKASSGKKKAKKKLHGTRRVQSSQKPAKPA